MYYFIYTNVSQNHENRWNLANFDHFQIKFVILTNCASNTNLIPFWSLSCHLHRKSIIFYRFNWRKNCQQKQWRVPQNTEINRLFFQPPENRKILRKSSLIWYQNVEKIPFILLTAMMERSLPQSGYFFRDFDQLINSWQLVSRNLVTAWRKK